jgi:integral membrane protein
MGLPIALFAFTQFDYTVRMQATKSPVFLKRLRATSLTEGVSTLVLFGAAMPLKYLAGIPMAVTIVGTLHGALFLVLCVMFLGAIRAVPLPKKWALLGIVAAIFPFGPFLFDRKLRDYE